MDYGAYIFGIGAIPLIIIEKYHVFTKIIKEFLSNSGGFYLAAMVDNKWFWVDWYTGKRTTKQV